MFVSYFTELFLGLFGNGPVGKIRYYVIAILLGVYGSFCNEPVNKKRHYLLANLLTLVGVHYILDQWFNQTLCIRCFNDII